MTEGPFERVTARGSFAFCLFREVAEAIGCGARARNNPMASLTQKSPWIRFGCSPLYRNTATFRCGQRRLSARAEIMRPSSSATTAMIPTVKRLADGISAQTKSTPASLRPSRKWALRANGAWGPSAPAR